MATAFQNDSDSIVLSSDDGEITGHTIMPANVSINEESDLMKNRTQHETQKPSATSGDVKITSTRPQKVKPLIVETDLKQGGHEHQRSISGDRASKSKVDHELSALKNQYETSEELREVYKKLANEQRREIMMLRARLAKNTKPGNDNRGD